MKRSLADIVGKSFDLVVVGGGVHGICVARDAALRGLSVALLERGDFGGETSHNSLKLVHGGLRYIQHFDFRRMRQSGMECRAWLRIAPHLVRPLKCAMHTYGHVDRRHIPNGEVVGKQQSDILIPGLSKSSHNGAAIWYDGQMQDADRIMIECLESAVAAGAKVANYVDVGGFLGSESRIQGVVAKDQLTGEEFDVRAKITINTAGPWTDGLRRSKGDKATRVVRRQPQNLNMNLVVRRNIAEHAFGVKSIRQSDSRVDDSGRLFFITPWRGVSVVGTTHEPYDGDADECFVDEAKIDAFISEVNVAYPAAQITPNDVTYCHWGLTPGEDGLQGGEARRARHGRIIDHRRENGLSGLISVIGVKWTTARLVAENTVNIAVKSIGGTAGRCQTNTRPLPGAERFESCEALAKEIRTAMPSVSNDAIVTDLAIEYGTRWREVAGPAIGEVDVDENEIFKRKAVFAVKNEMAVRLADVVCRRSNLMQRGKLFEPQVAWCLDMMADELDWSQVRKKSERATFEQQRIRSHAKILQ